MAFNLKNISNKNTNNNFRAIIYGPEGIGKTTFCAQAKDVIFILTEDGLGGNVVNTFPLAKTYEEVLDFISALYEQEHKFKTLVIDSLDWLEDLTWRYLAKKHNQPSIEGFGYGKGYVLAADALKEILLGLDELRIAKKMNIIFTAHSQVKRYDDPVSDAYDRYCLKLHNRSSAIASEWADIIGFASMQLIIKKEELGFDQKKSRAISSGDRILHLARTPAFDAKNRYGFPEAIPFNYEVFENLFKKEGAK